MSIGSTIKRLRREQDITQEQLAEYLGITSRAVSQWECDRTAPDISQLPALCHIFNVSSDLLLGIDLENKNVEISKYLDEANNLLNDGNFSERSELLREANKKFPRDYKIMNLLADSLVSEYSRKGIKEYEEVFELCNRILAECTDSTIRYEAIRTLAVAYNYAGMEDEMLKLAEEMPRTHFSYENFMVYRWKGNDALIERKEYINFLLHELFSMISCLSGHRDDEGKFIHSYEERAELRKLELDLIELLFPDGDYYMFAQNAEMVCSFFFSKAQGENDTEGAWYWVNKGADFAIHHDTYDHNAIHTSPLLRGYITGGWIMEKEGNDSQIMLDWLATDKSIDFLRSDERYTTLVTRLKNAAMKPE
ncbi:MAG: helix-turn-helix transcriptional regulator [Clostridia bacterium]|nr:helix-turn-helix transcriptional regulator [Clostridia bacterium]